MGDKIDEPLKNAAPTGAMVPVLTGGDGEILTRVIMAERRLVIGLFIFVCVIFVAGLRLRVDLWTSADGTIARIYVDRSSEASSNVAHGDTATQTLLANLGRSSMPPTQSANDDRWVCVAVMEGSKVGSLLVGANARAEFLDGFGFPGKALSGTVTEITESTEEPRVVRVTATLRMMGGDRSVERTDLASQPTRARLSVVDRSETPAVLLLTWMERRAGSIFRVARTLQATSSPAQ
jgi:hypothetical protein